MFYTIVNGSLFKKPEAKISKAGKAYTSAVLKSAQGNETVFVRITAFSESVCEEMAGLEAGDAASFVGSLTVELYEGGDRPRLSYSMVADRMLGLKKEKQPPKTRAPKPKPAGKSPSSRTNGDDYFPDDSVPF